MRYQGFPEFIKVLVDIDFLVTETKDFLKPSETPIAWKEATQRIIGASSSEESDLIWAISSRTKFNTTEEKNRIIAGLRWIGLFSEDKITPRSNPLATLGAQLEKHMQYGPSERDMVVLQHKFEIEHKDGKKETKTSTLIEYGDPKGFTAMAKLVGVPAAVAVKQILNGTLSQKGILAPMTPEINNPLMKELKEDFGIEMTEKTIA